MDEYRKVVSFRQVRRPQPIAAPRVERCLLIFFTSKSRNLCKKYRGGGPRRPRTMKITQNPAFVCKKLHVKCATYYFDRLPVCVWPLGVQAMGHALHHAPMVLSDQHPSPPSRIVDKNVLTCLLANPQSAAQTRPPPSFSSKKPFWPAGIKSQLYSWLFDTDFHFKTIVRLVFHTRRFGLLFSVHWHFAFQSTPMHSKKGST
ncbi:hypothetical protein CCANI_03600 [Corynebacterium canis]|nr:hypothetical protein CCANI_03600 [Corynebacterium canis]